MDDGPGLRVPGSLQMKTQVFSAQAINSKDKLNWLVHVLFLRQDFDECLKIIESMLDESQGRSEYANFLKALILRIKGNIHESLELFKKCHLLNPSNTEYLK